MDPFEETPRHVAGLLKVDLRLKLDNLVDSNKKISLAQSNARLHELFEKLKVGSGKPSQPSLQAATEKLEKYRALIREMESMNTSSGLGPLGEFPSLFIAHAALVWDVQSQYLSNRLLEEISTWASTTSEYLRNTETSLTNEIHSLELDLSTIQSTVSTKELILQQQEANDERVENELHQRFDDEKDRFQEEISRKIVEINRYRSMLQDLNDMHTATMTNMKAKQQDLRSKLELEREHVINEQKKLGNDRNVIKSETRSAEETRTMEKEQLEKSIEKQTQHISSLKKDLERIELDHTRNLNKKSEEYFKEVSQEQQNIAKEQKNIEGQLLKEYEAERALKKKEREELEEIVKGKERELRKMGIVVENALIDEEGKGRSGSVGSAVLGGGGKSAGKRGGKSGGKGDKGCKQS